MIHEEICTYEVCKLAKENGFPVKEIECWHYEYDGRPTKEIIDEQQYPNITQSLLQRWLREEKNIDIAIVPLFTGGYAYVVYNIHCRDNRVVNTNAGYATYELALEDALKYALENLI